MNRDRIGSESPFDDLTDVYATLIDWPKRLANEEPFYRRLFERLDARTVVDVACGTGQHAAMFHSWGLRVEGADVSPQMIEQARSSFGEPPGLRFVVRPFDKSIEASDPFDVAACVGNSLALAPDLAVAEQVIGQMLKAVRPGGAVVFHVLNLWRLADGPCVWQKCMRSRLPQGESLIIKGVSRNGTRGFVHLIVTNLDGSPALQTESIPFLGFESVDLHELARRAGATGVSFFGGYRDQPYRRQESIDLILVAEK